MYFALHICNSTLTILILTTFKGRSFMQSLDYLTVFLSLTLSLLSAIVNVTTWVVLLFDAALSHVDNTHIFEQQFLTKITYPF